MLRKLWIPLIVLGASAGTALACTSAAPTSLSTKLSGGGKEAEEITVPEGTGVKDQASLSGKNVEKATGSIEYLVYSDKECKTLLTKAGKFEFTGGKVPASEEKKLEAGAVYYWQVVYSGDSLDEKSTSPCGKEVLTVKAKTSLATTLSGGGKEDGEITVNEGTGVKDLAALSGTNVTKATGTVKYFVYKDKECKELGAEAGEGAVSGGKASSSIEEKLTAGAVYYWQAVYSGDSLHESSTSACGSEVATVKAATSLSTILSGGGEEGEEITVHAGDAMVDTATLSGTKSSTATGTAKYVVYKDKECKELVADAGEVTVEEGKVPRSEEKELEARTAYSWQVTYSGDSLHQPSASPCTEIGCVTASGGTPQPEPAFVDAIFPSADGTALTGTASTAATPLSPGATVAPKTPANGPEAVRVVALEGLSSSLSISRPGVREDDRILHTPSVAAVSVFTGQGISQAHARRALRLQSRISERQLVNRVESALAGAYAGAWLEPAAAKLHIGVTSDASKQAIASVIAATGLAGDVVQTPVRSSLAALEVIQGRWDARLAKLLQSGKAMTGIDSQRNAVVVKLSTSVPKQRRIDLERAAASATTNVIIAVAQPLAFRIKPQVANCEFVGSFLDPLRSERAAWCEKTITSGVEIVGPPILAKENKQNVCTAGPMLIEGDKTFVLTAGHCVANGEKKVGEEWLSEWPNSASPPLKAKKKLGKVTQFQYDKALDSAEIEVEQPGEFSKALPTPVPAKLAEWGNWQAYKGKPPKDEPTEPDGQAINPEETESRTVSNGLPAIQGFANCHEGKSTGEQCGQVGMTNVNPGGKIITEHLIEDTACSESGDSGGPYFYHGNGSEVFPEGTLVGGDGDGKCNGEGRPPGGGIRSYFESMQTLITAYGGGKQRLLWHANETRRPRVKGAEGAELVESNYTGASGATAIETVGGAELTCTADSSKGAANAESSGTAELTFTGCEAFDLECHTSGAMEGEVALNASYELVFTNGMEDEVGLLLELIESTIECGERCSAMTSETLRLRGTSIGAATPIDEEFSLSKPFTVAFTQSKGNQEPTEYETEEGTKAKATLEMEGSGPETFGFEQAGISDVDELLFEEAAEIEG